MPTKTALRLIIPGVLAVLLTACRPRPSDTFVVADLFNIPGKALATFVLSPTPSPTATLPNFPTSTPQPTIPLPTAILFQQPTQPLNPDDPTPTREVTPTRTPSSQAPDCSSPPDAPFTNAWLSLPPEAQATIGCPVGSPQRTPGAYQTYEHGAMFWRQNPNDSFVISEVATEQGQETGSWWRFPEYPWASRPEDDPSLQPPEGMYSPTMGFGLIWYNNGFIRQALGWGTSYVIGLDYLRQDFEYGWMLAGVDNAPIWSLAPTNEARTSGVHYGRAYP